MNYKLTITRSKNAKCFYILENPSLNAPCGQGLFDP